MRLVLGLTLLAVPPAAAGPLGPLRSVPALIAGLRQSLTPVGAPRPRAGDHVLIVAPDDRRLQEFAAPPSTLFLPALGRLYDDVRTGQRRVNALARTPDGEAASVLLPAEGWTRPLPRRRVPSALVELRMSVAPHLAFAPGETVRARLPDGGMARMEFAGPVRAGYGVDYRLFDPRTRRALTLPRRLVYKDAPGPEPPRTLERKDEISWAAFAPAQQGPVGAFLEGAAWLSSHPEFVAASHEQRWNWLADYVGAMMSSDNAFLYAEVLGLGFGDLLECGGGVCRHLATLLSAAGLESGYHVPVVLGYGHAWNEAHGPPGVEPWVFDLALGSRLPWTEAKRQAAGDARSFAARWYLRGGTASFPARRGLSDRRRAS